MPHNPKTHECKLWAHCVYVLPLLVTGSACARFRSVEQGAPGWMGVWMETDRARSSLRHAGMNVTGPGLLLHSASVVVHMPHGDNDTTWRCLPAVCIDAGHD